MLLNRSRILLFILFFPATLLTAASQVEFNRDVRPILSDKCYLCHGPDAKAKKIPLRLDHEQDAKAALPDGKHAVVEGHPELSEMIQRITAPSVARRMPPAYSGRTLSAKEIETLRDWIAQGAKWEKHWAFLPPKRAPLPAVKDAAWVKNPIDAFVLARLEREGLAPSPEASRETLIRRVSFDLTGLPPTLAEMDAFLADKSPDAYEKVVDRLLASPRYGERMAFRWLEAARYADTNGYQYDGGRTMWRWRDWVIDAFNHNEPYDRFAIDQLAGDLLPNATLDQKIATGFNRNHRINTEDGIVPEEYAVEYVVDRVDTTSAVFMGVTLGCARCHNHKYDPFLQKEFYQVFAYFNNVPELGRGMKYGNSPPVVAAPTREQQMALASLMQKIHMTQASLDRRDPAIAKAQARWERTLRDDSNDYWAPAPGLIAAFPLEAPHSQIEPPAPATLRPAGYVPGLLGQDSARASAPPLKASPPKVMGEELAYVAGRIGRAASFDGKTFLDAGAITRIDIFDPFTISLWLYSDSVPDGSLVSQMVDNPKGKGYGIHADHGKLQVNLTSVWADDSIRLETEETLSPARWHQVSVTYDGSVTAAGVHVYLDGRPVATKTLMDTLYRPYRNNNGKFSQPVRIGGGWGEGRRFRGLLDEVRLYQRALSTDEIDALATGETVAAIARKPAAQRTSIERKELRWYFLDNAAPAPARAEWQKLAELREEKTRLERTFPTSMVMEERPTRRETHILQRGAYDKPGELVEPGVPGVLPPLPPGAPANRLGFAQWLASASNPLFGRVAVNRFWQMYFGTGIVKTVEDFGSQGEWPTHPELLDWLATEFARTHWDVKAMQRLIVTSATYRQSSKDTPELVQRDPENRLLARGPRERLPAEMIRDQALAVSGLLAEKIGGPSVMPYQPPGLWKEISMQDTDYVEGHGADLYRRSLYTYWKRAVAPPMMVNFDAAMRETCVVRETRTDTPLQALNLMDDVQFLEAARLVGQRMMKEGGADPSARLRYGFRLVTGHYPTAAELEVLRGNLQFHLKYFASDPEKTKQYLSQGETPADPNLAPRELAAYASVASLLLNLDETVTKE